jgi:hypothetical protein
MINRSESTLFVQSALAMAGFIVFLTTMGWVMTPKSVVSQVPGPAVQLSNSR